MDKRNEVWQEIFPVQHGYQIAHEYPAINTGVLGFDRSCEPFHVKWQKHTSENVSFICDEICAQLLAFEFPHNILDERFNASPNKSYVSLKLWDLENSDVRIIHNHGNKGLKCRVAPCYKDRQRLFLEPYFEACEINLAGLADWDQKMPKHPKNFVERLEQKRRSWRKTGVVPKAADSDK